MRTLQVQGQSRPRPVDHARTPFQTVTSMVKVLVSDSMLAGPRPTARCIVSYVVSFFFLFHQSLVCDYIEEYDSVLLTKLFKELPQF